MGTESKAAGKLEQMSARELLNGKAEEEGSFLGRDKKKKKAAHNQIQI